MPNDSEKESPTREKEATILVKDAIRDLRAAIRPYIDVDSDAPKDWECEPEDRWRLGRDLKDQIEEWEELC